MIVRVVEDADGWKVEEVDLFQRVAINCRIAVVGNGDLRNGSLFD